MEQSGSNRSNADVIAALSRASTATITTILRHRGVNNIWMPLKPLQRGMKIVGPALTIRTVPGRDDLQELAYQPDTKFPGHPDAAIAAVQPGNVVVLDGRGITAQGLFGDLLTLRIKMRGAAGLVSDMCVRDSQYILGHDIPVFSRGSSSPGGTVFNVDYNVPIGCAGVLVCPGDMIVGDDDGVVVIPPSLLDEVIEEVLVHEDRERYIRILLSEGHPLEGIYPMGEEYEAKFRVWRANQTSN